MNKPYTKLLSIISILVLIIPIASAQPFIDFDPYEGSSTLLMINVFLYVLIFWLMNNQRVNVEKFMQKFQENAPEKIVTAIKIEIFFKNIGIFLLAILNLIVAGFFYHAWTEYEAVGTELAFLVVAMNMIIIVALFFLFIIQLWYFPFQFVKESAKVMMEGLEKNAKK